MIPRCFRTVQCAGEHGSAPEFETAGRTEKTSEGWDESRNGTVCSKPEARSAERNVCRSEDVCGECEVAEIDIIHQDRAVFKCKRQCGLGYLYELTPFPAPIWLEFLE